MSWQTPAGVDQLWAGLDYREQLVHWGTLEQGLEIVPPPDDKGPPDFLLRLDGWDGHRPLTKTAAAQFGRLSGVRPAIYKEFVKDGGLTAQMIHYSMNRPDRGGAVYVASTNDSVVGFYNAEKPFLGAKSSYDLLATTPGVCYVDAFFNPDGVWEFVVTLGDLSKSVTPGLYMAHGGRPVVGIYSILHDRSAVLGPVKPPKKRKSKEACESAASEFIASRGNEAIGEGEAIYNLAGRVIENPVRFLSRLSLMDGFSSQASDQMVSGASEAFRRDDGSKPSHYDAVRYVASLADNNEKQTLDRRFQLFAHYVAFRGATCCTSCGLPE